MKKRKDLLACVIFILVFIAIYLFVTKDGYLFASTTDFKTQHYLIPDYFRQLFYDTYDLFPDFAFNLGGGQNIYYFSYYGLLNPIILISYLFPFIKMIDYLIFTNCLIVISSTILFYFYLKKNNYKFETRFITAFLFLCSGPLIFHAHRHVMFINYMPFLIMGLYGIDRYYEKNKIGLLITSITLMIFTSYYYSVSGIVVLFIYMIYKYLKNNKKIDFKSFIKQMLKNCIPFIISIMIGAVIILPTLYTLLNGREATIKVISLIDLLKPSLGLLYNTYSVGLTIISLISIVVMMFSKKTYNRFLSFLCLVICLFPIFNYVFNGTLYINSKSLIPFLPIILIIVAEFLTYLFKKINNIEKILIITYLLISSFVICIMSNSKDKLIKSSDINNESYNTTIKLINEVIKEDNKIYRINNSVFKAEGINNVTNINEYKTTLYSSTYNSDYSNFYFDTLNNPLPHRNRLMTASSNNLLSQMFFNEKYILTKDYLGLDLELVKEKNNIKVYKNNNTLPIGYASSKLISIDEYNKLKYPNNVINLLNHIIVDKKVNNKNIINAIKLDIDYSILEKNNLEIIEDNNYKIISKNDSSIKIKLNEDMTNKIMFVRFKNLLNPDYDTSITINNVQNKLTDNSWKYHNKNYTFDYVLYDTDILEIKFIKGIYELNNFEFYIIDYDEIKNINKNVDEFKIDKKLTKGDKIVGDIDVKEDGYFTLSIPYDKGFKIFVDGKLTEYEKVNKSFIGFEISKGKHHIDITYEAPYKNIALALSSIGLLTVIIYQVKKYLKNK